MTDEKKTGKVGKVLAPESTKRIEPTKHIRAIDSVKATQGVKRISNVGTVKSASFNERALTNAQRNRLLGMIEEEADKLFATGGIPKARRDIVKRAVKMAVDSGIILKENGANGSESVNDSSDSREPIAKNEHSNQSKDEKSHKN